jgi:serine/threonine protein kinase
MGGTRMKMQKKYFSFLKVISSITLVVFIFSITRFEEQKEWIVKKYFNMHIAENVDKTNKMLMFTSDFKMYSEEFINDILKNLVIAYNYDPVELQNVINIIKIGTAKIPDAPTISFNASDQEIQITVNNKQYTFTRSVKNNVMPQKTINNEENKIINDTLQLQNTELQEKYKLFLSKINTSKVYRGSILTQEKFRKKFLELLEKTTTDALCNFINSFDNITMPKLAALFDDIISMTILIQITTNLNRDARAIYMRALKSSKITNAILNDYMKTFISKLTSNIIQKKYALFLSKFLESNSIILLIEKIFTVPELSQKFYELLEKMDVNLLYSFVHRFNENNIEQLVVLLNNATNMDIVAQMINEFMDAQKLSDEQYKQFVDIFFKWIDNTSVSDTELKSVIACFEKITDSKKLKEYMHTFRSLFLTENTDLLKGLNEYEVEKILSLCAALIRPQDRYKLQCMINDPNLGFKNTFDFLEGFSNEEKVDIISSLTDQGLINLKKQYIRTFCKNKITNKKWQIRYINDLTLDGWNNMMEVERLTLRPDILNALNLAGLDNRVVVFNNINPSDVEHFAQELIKETEKKELFIEQKVYKIMDGMEELLPIKDEVTFTYFVKKQYEKYAGQQNLKTFFTKFEEKWCKSSDIEIQESRKKLFESLKKSEDMKNELFKKQEEYKNGLLQKQTEINTKLGNEQNQKEKDNLLKQLEEVNDWQITIKEFSNITRISHVTAASPTELKFPNNEEIKLYPYALKDVLGKGAHGKVRLGSYNNGKYVAVKELTLKDIREMDIFWREIIELQKVGQKVGPVRMFASGFSVNDIFEDYKQKRNTKEFTLKIYLVMPLYVHSLKEKIDEAIKLNEEANSTSDSQKIKEAQQANSLLKKYVFQVAIELERMHKAGLIHKDVKLENIMIDKEENAYLVDFGLMREVNADTMAKVGTAEYMPLEYKLEFTDAKGVKYNKQEGKEDVWALGRIICKLLFLPTVQCYHYDKTKIIKSFDEIHLQLDVFNSDFLNLKQKVKALKNPALEDLLFNKIYVKNPYYRATMAEIIEHPYFQQMAVEHFVKWLKENKNKLISKYENEITTAVTMIVNNNIRLLINCLFSNMTTDSQRLEMYRTISNSV